MIIYSPQQFLQLLDIFEANFADGEAFSEWIKSDKTFLLQNASY